MTLFWAQPFIFHPPPSNVPNLYLDYLPRGVFCERVSGKHHPWFSWHPPSLVILCPLENHPDCSWCLLYPSCVWEGIPGLFAPADLQGCRWGWKTCSCLDPPSFSWWRQSWHLFLPFLKEPFQLPKPFRDNQARPSASFLSSHGCIPSHPKDLCVPSGFKCFLTLPSSAEGKTFLLQN